MSAIGTVLAGLHRGLVRGLEVRGGYVDGPLHRNSAVDGPTRSEIPPGASPAGSKTD